MGLGILERARSSTGPRLIALVGGQPDAKVVAFDKMTGKEIWRALSSESELGVAQPIIITAGGTRQLIIWYPGAVASLDPATGKVYWEQPYKVGASMTVPTPVQSGSLLFFTNFYDGPLMLALDEQKPAATVLWKGKSDNEIQTDGLHAVISDAGDRSATTSTASAATASSAACVPRPASASGKRRRVTKERARWASGLIVRHGDRLFINNDRGELIIAKPRPDGLSRRSAGTFLLKPTSPPGNRRETGERQLVASGLREPPHLRAQRRGDHRASLAEDGK